MLLTLQTRLHRYASPSDPAFQLRVVPAGKRLPERDADNRPLLAAELGPLLNGDDTSTLPRRHALLVPLRRRSVLLLFDEAGELEIGEGELQPIPPFLNNRLSPRWVQGVCSVGDELLLVLDLRAIATHAAANAASQLGDRP